MKRVYLLLLLLVGLLLISSSQVHFTIDVQSRYECTENDRIAKYNLHRVQLAIERYAADNPTGEYPPDLQTLIDSKYGYLREWPHNPYSKGNPGIFLRMHQVEIGNFMPGGILYYPYEYPGYKGLCAYKLTVYGATPDSGNLLMVVDKQGVHRQGLLILLSSQPEPRGVF